MIALMARGGGKMTGYHIKNLVIALFAAGSPRYARCDLLLTNTMLWVGNGPSANSLQSLFCPYFFGQFFGRNSIMTTCQEGTYQLRRPWDSRKNFNLHLINRVSADQKFNHIWNIKSLLSKCLTNGNNSPRVQFSVCTTAVANVQFYESRRRNVHQNELHYDSPFWFLCAPRRRLETLA